MNRFTGAVCAALALLVAAPSSSRPSPADPGARRLVAQPAAASGKDTVDVFGIARTGINLTARDPSVRPGNDFFLHANGAWNRFVRDRLVTTGGSASLHSLINEEAENQVREIIERPADDPAGRQVAALYRSFMDEARIERLGIAPIRPLLDRIAAIRNRTDLIATFAANGFVMPVEVGVIPDATNANRYVLAIAQGGTLMPTRDHYLREGPEFERYRAAYRTYLVTALRLAGVADPEAKAALVAALERRLAETHLSPEQSRDVRQAYNPMTRAQLQALAPQFDWPTYLDAMGFDAAQRVIVYHPGPVAAAGPMLDQVPLETWKAWLTFHLVDSFAPYLSTPFQEAHFAFQSRALFGQPSPHPRAVRATRLIDATLGESIGVIYLNRYFSARSRAVMTELVDNVRAAFAERLRQLDWMDEPTRREALAKLDRLETRIGGPARPDDLTSVRMDPQDLVGNVLRLSEYGLRRDGQRLAEPVDRGTWQVTAQTVGATYNSLTNQVTLPAGILQRPMFHPDYDAAVNYGRIGAVVGHELGHGFDDQGRRFDGQGQLRDWWTATAAARFEAQVERLGRQFGAYEPLPGFRINPVVTMGENIGDLGGLELAYAAYRRHVAQHGEPPVVEGLSGDQRFFMAYAQTWAGHTSEDLLRQMVLTDEHSPPAYRVNGIVRNMDAWYRAFDVQPGDRLYLPPDQRVRIW